jgi:hypothetical protein
MNVYIKKYKFIFLSGILLLLVGLLLGYNVNAESDVITMLIGTDKKNYVPVFKLSDCCLVPGSQIGKNFNIEVKKIYLKDFNISNIDKKKIKENDIGYKDFTKYVNFTVKNDDDILYNGSLQNLLINEGKLNGNKKIILRKNEMESIDITVSMSGDAGNSIHGLQGKFNLVVFCTGEDQNSGGDSGGNSGGHSGHNSGGGSGYTPKGDTNSDPTENLEESSGEEPVDEEDDEEDLDEEIESPDEEVPEEIIPEENPEDDENNLVDDGEKDSEKDETDEEDKDDDDEDEEDDELIEISDEEIPQEIDKLVQTGSPIDTLSLIIIAGIFILSGIWIVFKKSKE